MKSAPSPELALYKKLNKTGFNLPVFGSKEWDEAKFSTNIKTYEQAIKHIDKISIKWLKVSNSNFTEEQFQSLELLKEII